jgi:hypothetical protein
MVDPPSIICIKTQTVVKSGFIGLTTCFSRAWPSSGQSSFTINNNNKEKIYILYRGFYLDVLHIRVFNEIWLLTGFCWLDLYEYKRFIRLHLEAGMGKLARKTKTRKLGGVLGWILGAL